MVPVACEGSYLRLHRPLISLHKTTQTLMVVDNDLSSQAIT